MKTIIFIAAILIGVTSCQKKSSPAPVSPSTNNSVALNSTELQLVGNWSYDKQELLSNGTVIPGPGGTVYFNDSTVYHIEFTSTYTTGTYKKCINGTSGSDYNNDWEATSNTKLFIQNTTYSIESLTSTNLIYYSGSLTSGAAIRYSFHKL